MTAHDADRGSEHAELLADVDAISAGMPNKTVQGILYRAAAALRALEAKVREKHEALESACSLAERTHRMLQELLARIHRDGGHYATEHGLEKASEDADQIVAELFADRDHWKHSFDRMAGDAFAEKRRNEALSADRDRLTAEVEDAKRSAQLLAQRTLRLDAEVAALREELGTAIARIKDMLMDDDGQAWKEARKFIAACERRREG